MMQLPVFEHFIENSNSYLRINIGGIESGNITIPLKLVEQSVSSDSDGLTKFKAAMNNVVFHHFIKDITSLHAGYIIITPPRTAINVSTKNIIISNALTKISIKTTENGILSLAEVIREHIKFCDTEKKDRTEYSATTIKC